MEKEKIHKEQLCTQKVQNSFEESTFILNKNLKKE